MISSMKKKVAGSANTNNGPILGGPTFQYTAADFGVADQVTVSAAPNSFISYNAQTRIIFPDNYVSNGEKSIIAINDYNLPA